MNKEKIDNEQLIKSEAKRLWTECFNDNPKFVDFYFDKVFKAEECKLHFYRFSLQAIAQVHLPIYRFALAKGLEISANYISGACTDKDFRQKGVMSKMLKEVLLEAGAEGELSASFLIPATEELAEYYRKHFAYESLLYRRETSDLSEILEMSESLDLDDEFTEAIPFLLAYEEAMNKPHIKHTREQWENVFAEYKLNPDISKIQSYYSNEGELQAIILYRLNPEEEEIIIDALYGSLEAKEILLNSFELQYPTYQIKAYICSAKKNTDNQTYIMWRPLNLMPFLIIYAHRNRDLELDIVVEDDLTQERKAYHIAAGEVIEQEDLKGQVYNMRDFVRDFVYIEHIALLHE